MEYTIIRDEDYLEHHGIKGQKWGVRKYQNEDGSYTQAGKERYGIGDGETYSGVKGTSAKKQARIEKKNSRYGQKMARRMGMDDEDTEDSIDYMNEIIDYHNSKEARLYFTKKESEKIKKKAAQEIENYKQAAEIGKKYKESLMAIPTSGLSNKDYKKQVDAIFDKYFDDWWSIAWEDID